MGKRIKLGDIFEIKTSKGLVYIQYVHKNNLNLEMIKVYDGIFNQGPENLEYLKVGKERFFVHFPLLAAYKQGIVEFVCNQGIGDFKMPQYMRTPHKIRDEFLGWHIVNTESMQRSLVTSLSEDQRKLSPWGVWNDTLLKERLESGWSLENWNQ